MALLRLVPTEFRPGPKNLYEWVGLKAKNTSEIPMTIKKSRRNRVGWQLLWAAAFVLTVVALIQVGILPSPFANSTRTLSKIRDLGGNDYEITYTNSDALAKNEYISVYVMKNSQGMSGLFHKKILLLKYDPATSIDPPSITGVNSNTVRISVPRVSSIFYERHNWGSLSVDYDIGQVDYQ
jgi:hypothetical protein